MVATVPAVRLTFKSDEFAVRSALKSLLERLDPLKLDPEETGTIELVVAEALNNVVEHAYPEGQPSGPVNVRCLHKRDGLHITITDQGVGMPDGQTPLGQAVNVDVDMMDMPEGGFGWFLIQDLAKDVEYKRVGWENHLSLRLAVGICA